MGTETPVTRENADKLYQAMWNRAPKRRPDHTYTTSWGGLLLQMIGHCDAAALLYPANNSDDEYRRCMWQWRAHLHRTGWHDKVWLGEDPVVMMAGLQSGRIAPFAGANARAATGEEKQRDKHRLGEKQRVRP